MKLKLTIASLALGLLSACTVIHPGQIGMKQSVGKLKKDVFSTGIKFFNPFITKIVKLNVRTVEIYRKLDLPTKEGLNVKTEIILLYHVNPKKAREIYINYGRNYQKVIVESNFLATAREISARYSAKELYAIKRELVEETIAAELKKDIESKGFVIDGVLLKEIILPETMTVAIQQKATAEQAALQMEFVIQKAKKEAERLKIEAEGIKKAQTIINSSLTDALLKYDYIEMMRSLSASSNAKIIVTNGKTPIMLEQ